MLETLCLAPLAYLLGSVPSAIIIGKTFYNVDVRNYGSGNAGTMNTVRVLGFKAALPVLIFDILKGFLATQLVIFTNVHSADAIIKWKIIFGCSAILGHIFPIYLKKMKGGKGVATIYGVVWALHWQATLICTLLYLLMMTVFRYASLSSIVAGIGFPILVCCFFKNPPIIDCFSILFGLLIIFTHRSNIARLLKGQESKINFRKKKA